jgi:CubicO group peptidase (beta-lactamase class C family)
VLRDLISTGDAAGDPGLVEQLVGLRGRLTRTIAAAVIDLDAQPIARWAHLTTNRPRTVTSPEVTVDADPRFELGSVAKGLTGMLLADSIARGELTLDTTVGEILAGTPSLAARTEGALPTLTLRELVTHTSGLPRLPRSAQTVGRLARLALLGMDPYRGQSSERVLEQAARQPLRDRGGYRYSNLGGAVAGQLIAIAAGSDYPTALRKRILQPLQMTSSSVATRDHTAARGRTRSGLSRQAWVLDGYAPAGGVISTIEDVNRLTQALTDGTAPGIDALTPIPDVASAAPDRASGMFWVIEQLGDATLTWHNGMTAGYAAFLGVLRDRGRGVAVLADAARGPEQRAIALELLGLSPAR